MTNIVWRAGAAGYQHQRFTRSFTFMPELGVIHLNVCARRVLAAQRDVDSAKPEKKPKMEGAGGGIGRASIPSQESR